MTYYYSLALLTYTTDHWNIDIVYNLFMDWLAQWLAIMLMEICTYYPVFMNWFIMMVMAKI